MDVLSYLNKSLDLEERGYADNALGLLQKIILAFPEQQNEICIERAKMKFRNGYEREALLDFITLYDTTEDQKLYELILLGVLYT